MRQAGGRIIPYEAATDLDTVELAPLRAEDATVFSAACEMAGVHTHRHFFPSLHFYSGSGRLCWERHGDSIIVYQILHRPDRMKLYLAPFPFAPEALRHALERMRDFNRGGLGRVKWIPEEDALDIARQGLSVSFREDEYIFARETVMKLEGSDFAKLRQELARARRAGEVTLRPYRAEDEAACLALAEAWKARLESAGVKVGGHRTKRTCLAEAQRLAPPLLSGMVAEVDGILRGFAFAGRITGEMGCNYLSTTDSRYRGLPHLLCYALMEAMPELPYFNDGNDAGRPGLREQKERFRPVRKLGLYGAVAR